ncbi:MAG: CARDB domain-containing protein, partial [Planctomycetota bacterium]|nr:CARDB domain-containing protein [Planctomycetota bacterium]
MARTGSNARGLAAATLLLSLVLPALAGCSSGGGAEDSGASSGLAVNADLEAASLTTIASGLEAGESFPVSLRVRNLGPDPIPGFRMAVRLSVDDQVDAADLVLGTWSSAGLGVEGAFEATGTVQVPVAAAPGVYRLLLVADDDQRHAETDETNNLLVAPGALLVSPPAHPDLIAEAVSFGPSTAAAGSTVDVSHRISNQGHEASGSFRLGIYLSTSPVVTTAGLLIGQRAISALDIGETDAASGAVTIPSFVSPGTYFVGALCDDQQQVVEMDEANNGLVAAAPLSVTSAPLPDLAPVSLTLERASVDAGQPLVFEERVLNQGVADAALFQVGLYLSTDVDIDPADDVLLGSRAVPGLAAGLFSDSGAQSLVIPGSTAAGVYFVGLVVDAGDFVAEAVEDDNVLLAGTTLSVTVPPLPDLRADSFDFGPGALVADGSGVMTVSAGFSNAGTATSAAVQATVYLSSDNAVTTADIAVGAVQVEALAPGSGVGRTVDLPLPGG